MITRRFHENTVKFRWRNSVRVVEPIEGIQRPASRDLILTLSSLCLSLLDSVICIPNQVLPSGLREKSDFEFCDAAGRAKCEWRARSLEGTQTGSIGRFVVPFQQLPGRRVEKLPLSRERNGVRQWISTAFP